MLIKHRNALIAAAATALAVAAASPGQAGTYQKRMPLLCDGGLCLANFLTVPAGKTLRLRAASCQLVVNVPLGESTEIAATGVWILSGTTTVGVEFMPLEHLSELRNSFTLATMHSYLGNEPIVLTATAGQKVLGFIEMPQSKFLSGECHVSGTLSP